jgi:hypothetical protein
MIVPPDTAITIEGRTLIEAGGITLEILFDDYDRISVAWFTGPQDDLTEIGYAVHPRDALREGPSA